MKYYSVLDVTPTTQNWIAAYLPTANQLVTKHGGQYIARTQTHEQLEGEAQPVGLRIIIEWTSKEGAQAFMNDETYAQHLKNRTAGSISHHYLIAGQDDFA